MDIDLAKLRIDTPARAAMVEEVYNELHLSTGKVVGPLVKAAMARIRAAVARDTPELTLMDVQAVTQRIVIEAQRRHLEKLRALVVDLQCELDDQL